MVIVFDAVEKAPLLVEDTAYELESVEELETAKSKDSLPRHRLSRRGRIWARIAATFFTLVLIRVYLLLKTNEKDIEFLSSLLDVEQDGYTRQHHLHALDVMLNPKKSENLFLYVSVLALPVSHC